MLEATRNILLLGLLATLLAGCGVRGSLELPPEAPRQTNSAQADSGQGKPANEAPKAHQPFILDGLIQ